MRRNRSVTLLALSASAFAIASCASNPDQHIVYYGPVVSSTALVSLGAGDSLGREIYVNDIVLAATQRAAERDTALADSPVDQE